MNNKKPVIEDIPKEALAELEQALEINANSKRGAWKKDKTTIIHKFMGICSICGDIPSKKIIYDVGDGAQRIQWSCDNCLKRCIEK